MKLPSSPTHPAVGAAAAFLVCLGLVVLGWWGASQQVRRLAAVEFEAVANDATAAILKRMADYEQILRGAAGLIDADQEVSRAEWRRYVDRLDVDEHYPGIQGIGFAKWVPKEELARHEAAVRAEGFRQYAVNPDWPRDGYFPIVFLEPFAERNLRAFGYDMFSEPTRRAAMQRARDEGRSVLSSGVTLVQETGHDVQAGTLLYLPVYRQGHDLSTVEGRRAAIKGFVYSPFRMNDLMAGILGGALGKLQVRVHDGAERSAPLLFRRDLNHRGMFRHSQVLDIFGRPWLVEVEPTPAMERAIDRSFPRALFVAGLIISLLVARVTHAMMSERSRRIAVAEANARLAETNADLLEARAEADAASRAKSKFLAAASHDIRQPVQSMAYLLYILRERLAGHPAGAVVGDLDDSLAALRMLLDGLLDISKLDAGVVLPEVAEVPLAPLLHRLGQEYRPRAREKGLDLRVVACSARIATDPALIERILRNLIENALRYTEKGRILIGCRRAGARMRIAVHDTGIGIAEHQLEEIFQEFHQVGNQERDRSKGLGLGLSIVQRLAQVLGHEVMVSSRLGRGSCFAIEVPLLAAKVPAAAVAAVPAAAPPAPRPRLGLVLVIDDEELVLTGLRMVLASWASEVVAATDGDEAVRLLAGRRPEVILADYRLRANRTGIEAIAQVQRLHDTPIPGIIITGDTDPARIAEAVHSGHRILHKPVAPAQLRDILAA